MAGTGNRAAGPVIDCAVCVIRDRSRVLIAQRNEDDSFGGFWEFPGGKKENGETLEACAVREALEEVGLRIEVEKRLMTVRNPYRERHINLHFFLCRAADVRARPLECRDCRWVEVRELAKYSFPPANETVIAFLRQNPAPASA